MKEIVPAPPAIVRNESAEIQSLFQQNVVPSYGRFDLVLSHGSGSQVWDVAGKRYLDLGGGVAVLALGHSPRALTDTLIEQSRKLKPQIPKLGYDNIPVRDEIELELILDADEHLDYVN